MKRSRIVIPWYPDSEEETLLIQKTLSEKDSAKTLFLLNAERFFFYSGLNISPGYKKHILKKMPHPTLGTKILYQAVFDGEVTFNNEVEIYFEPQKELKEKPPDTELNDPLPGSLIQISEEVVQGIIDEQFRADQFETHWVGELELDWTEYSTKTIAKFDLSVIEHKVRLDPNRNTVVIQLKIKGTISLVIKILNLDNPNNLDYSETITFDVETNIDAQGPPCMEKTNGDFGAVFIKINDESTMKVHDIKVFNSVMSDELKVYLEKAVYRIAKVQLAKFKRIAVSYEFDRTKRNGTTPESFIPKIVGSPPGALRNSNALSMSWTFPGNTGEAKVNLIPGGADYYVRLNRKLIDFLFLTLKPSEPFKAYESGSTTVWMDGLKLAMKNGYFEVDAHAWIAVKCLPDPDAYAKVKLNFESFEEIDEGVTVFHTRLHSVGDPEIRMSIWDRILYSLIGLIFVGSIFGAELAFVIVVLLNVFISMLEHNGGIWAGNAIGSIETGMKGKIPGTNYIALATTPVAPVITEEDVTASGSVKLIPVP